MGCNTNLEVTVGGRYSRSRPVGMRLCVHTPKSSVVMPSCSLPVICSPFITTYDLDCVCHSGRYNGWYCSCLHNLCRLHSHVDTRECCLLRDIKKATVKQIILECINSFVWATIVVLSLRQLYWAEDSKPDCDSSVWSAAPSLGSLLTMWLYLKASHVKRWDGFCCAGWWHILRLW